MSSATQPRSLPPHFEIKVGIHGVGAFVTKSFKAGETLFILEGHIILSPTRTSVQVSEQEHIEDALAGRLNHSCEPNAKIDRMTRSFVSLRDIAAGEEITFNYNDNEDKLAEPFTCLCCGRRIVGKNITLVQNT